MAACKENGQMTKDITDSDHSSQEYTDVEDDSPFTLPKKKSRAHKTTNATATPTANRFNVLTDMNEDNQTNSEENSRTKSLKFFHL